MFPTKGNRPASAGSGFTLVELMVGMSLSLTIIAVTLAAWIFVGRNFTRMANTQYLEAHTRSAFTLFSTDVGSTTKVSTATATSLALTVPAGSVSYAYSSANGTLTRTDTSGTATVLISDLTSFSFNYFNTTGTTAIASPSTASVKKIEMSFTSKLGNSSDNLKQSVYSTVSSRVALSNRPLLQ
jgi:Tfp pilus assembly protein PilW